MPSFRAHATGGTATSNTPVTVSFTPFRGDLIVVLAVETGSSTAGSVTDNAANNGLTGYYQVASATYSGGVVSAWVHNYFALEAVLTGTARNVTYTPGSSTNTGAQISVIAVQSPTASGEPSIRQFATNTGIGGTIASTTYSEAALTGNMHFTFIGNGTNIPSHSVPSGFSLGHQTGQGAVPLGLITAFANSGITASLIQWGTNTASNWGMITFELNSAAKNGVYSSVPQPSTGPRGRHAPLVTHQNTPFHRPPRSAGMAVIEIKHNTAVTVPVVLRGVSTGLGVAGIPSSAITVQIRKNGATYTTITPTITDRGGGTYDLALTSSHSDTLGIGALRVSASGNGVFEPVMTNDDVLLNVIAIDKQNAHDMGLGAIRLVSGVVVADGANTATDFKTNLTQTEPNHFQRTFCVFTSGVLDGQVAKVGTFDGATKFLGFGSAGFTTAPAPGDTFYLINR